MSAWPELVSERPDAFTRAPVATRTGLQSGWLLDPTPEVREAGVLLHAFVSGVSRLDPGLRDEPSPQREPSLRLQPSQPLLPASVRPWSRKQHGGRFWRHPLEQAPLLQGTDASARRELRRHFRSQVPRRSWTSAWAAERHLRSLLPAWPVVTWSEVRGLHLFLGAAGAGKTTLLFSVARELQARGRKVTAIALLAADRPRRAAFAGFAADAGAAVAFAATAAELDAVLAAAAGQVVLLDTPCLLERRAALAGLLRHPVLRHPRAMLHLCLSLQHRREVLEGALRAARLHRFDCLAVSHLDGAGGAGFLVGLQLRGPWPLSFARHSSDPGVPPLHRAPQALLGATVERRD